MILLAGVTSLPELVSGLTAVTVLNAPNLAIGGIVGSNLFNLTLIAVMDVAYQPGSILAHAQDGHILSGGLGILLMGLIAMAPLVGPTLNGVGILGISFVSMAIVVLYLIGARLLSTFQRKRAEEVLEQEAEVLYYDRISRRRADLTFIGAALVVVAAGVWLSTLADQISAATGLGRSFVGALLLGVSQQFSFWILLPFPPIEIGVCLPASRLEADFN